MASPTSTEPYSPELDRDPVNNDNVAGDFARLFPTNPLALEEFDLVARKHYTDKRWMPHAHKFIVSWKDGDRFVGFWRLNMDVQPQDIQKGWILGSGNPRMPNKVDIVLTSMPRVHGISERHCRLVHHPENGILLLEARYDTLIDGKDILSGLQGTLRHDESTRTVEKEMGIGLGNLCYKIAFTKFSTTPQYTSQLDKVRSLRGIAQRPLSETPTPAIRNLGRWRLYHAMRGGSFGTVAIGYDSHTADLVAVKTLRRQNLNYDTIIKEIMMLRAVSHPNVCCLKAIYPQEALDRVREDFAHGEVDEIHLIMSPAANVTLDRHKAMPVESLQLFRDCCLGISHLHERGIMHRDIKPSNIGVCLSHPPKAVILDLGSASTNKTSEDDMAGTVRYLAPEVIAIKEWKRDMRRPQPPPYDSAVDVWGIGISFSEMLDGLVPWKEVNLTEWRDRLNQQKHVTYPQFTSFLKDLSSKAISWQAKDRPSATTLAENAETYLQQNYRKRELSP